MAYYPVRNRRSLRPRLPLDGFINMAKTRYDVTALFNLNNLNTRIVFIFLIHNSSCLLEGAQAQMSEGKLLRDYKSFYCKH